MDSHSYIVALFEVYQQMDTVCTGETFDEVISMFMNSTNEVVCHTDIDGPIRFARHDVNVILVHLGDKFPS